VDRQVKVLGTTEKEGMKHCYTATCSFRELTCKYMLQVCSPHFRKGYRNLEKQRIMIRDTEYLLYAEEIK